MPRGYKHGYADSHRLYSTWKSMRTRCNNPNVGCYKYYGGKGIKVCSRWDDFTKFLEDMESTFEEGKTLDRIDPNGDYNPYNCRWATREEQANNQTHALKLFYRGKFYNEHELSRVTGVPRSTLQARRKRGLSVEEMVHGPNRV